MNAIEWAERGWVPERLERMGIRRLLRDRLRESTPEATAGWIEAMRAAPVALHTQEANDQHYELPASFYSLVLGEHLKYSGCLWADGVRDLSGAEEAMLELTCARAQVQDGQRILELGCGWGSLTLWMGERFPNARVVAVSNSASQRAFIAGRAQERGLTNVEVVTCDMNAFRTTESFDRVVSVEMFEHMRNWEELLGRISGWLTPSGCLFLHVFAHRDRAYPFEAEGASNWMGREFFTGGMMPSHDLLDRLRIPFDVERKWIVGGEHYAKTAEAWLQNLYANREQVLRVFADTYGRDRASVTFHRWRLFFLACAELFGFNGGGEWWVTHARLRPAPTLAGAA